LSRSFTKVAEGEPYTGEVTQGDRDGGGRGGLSVTGELQDNYTKSTEQIQWRYRPVTGELQEKQSTVTGELQLPHTDSEVMG
jgi:hypothetical protein